MKYRSSEIFDLYAEIALKDLPEEDLQKFASEEDPSKKTKEEISVIEALYGIKAVDDAKSLFDQAHPETAVVAPAYDRFNGVVENERERQDMTIKQVMKNPGGAHTNKRLLTARQALIDELVRVGHMMDHLDEESLMKKADTFAKVALEEVEAEENFGQLHKIAWIPAALWGINALFGLYIAANTTVSDDVITDASEAMNEIEDLLSDSEYSGFHPTFLTLNGYLTTIKNAAERFKNMNNFVNNVAPKTVEEKKDAIEKAKSAVNSDPYQKDLEFLERYKRAASFLLRKLPEYLSVLKLMQNKFVSTWWEKTWSHVSQSDIEDVIDHLQDLSKSLSKVPQVVDEQIRVMNQLKDKVNDPAELEKILADDKPGAPSDPAAKSEAPKAPESDEDAEIKDLEKSLHLK